jgi:hypothetical protein
MLSCNVGVEMDHQKWGLNREIIYKFKQFHATGVGKGAIGARRTHLLYVPIHPWQINVKTEAVQGAIRVEVPSDGISVKHDE